MKIAATLCLGFLVFSTSAFGAGTGSIGYNPDNRAAYYERYIKKLEEPFIKPPAPTPYEQRFYRDFNRERKVVDPLSEEARTPNPFLPQNSSDDTAAQVKAIDERNKKEAEEKRLESSKFNSQEWNKSQRMQRAAQLKFEKQKRHAELFHAIYKGDTKALQINLRRDYDPDITHEGYSLIHYAASLRNPEIITLLLQQDGLEIGTEENRYYNLMHWAAYENHLNIIRMLINKGANPQVRDKDGRTPLFYANDQKHQEIVNFLSRYN